MFGRLLSALGIAALRAEIAAILGRFRFVVLLLALGAILWLLALGFAIAAVTVWLVGLVGSVAACAIMTAIFVVAAIATHVIAVVTKPPPSPLGEAVASATHAMATATEAVAHALTPPPATADATDVEDVDEAPEDPPSPAAPRPRRKRAPSAPSGPKK
jgi:hypothetical protein